MFFLMLHRAEDRYRGVGLTTRDITTSADLDEIWEVSGCCCSKLLLPLLECNGLGHHR